MTRPAANPPALLIRKEEYRRDAATERRGYRKLLVTELYPGEAEAGAVEWSPGIPCPVLIDPNCEVAVFNERAHQDRHYHPHGTETYLVVEGSMRITVEGREYVLGAGDLISIPAGSVHQVQPGEPFTTVVITTKLGGLAEKVVMG